ncbi:anti-sigma factor family protein [Nocardia gipuzkoensis]|uniref:anti-sigma factor family protein n=1 Tax=Nocardia gipuzkoensis TaxID=2749991 RepID=UPI0015EF3255|nr:zf-HC2 domain-containing protein [Nocardia gipuzkoensis]
MEEIHCIDLVERVTDFLEGALSEDEERRFLDHLQYCDGCDRYLDQLRHTINALNHQPSPGLSNEMKKALLAEFRSQSS